MYNILILSSNVLPFLCDVCKKHFLHTITVISSRFSLCNNRKNTVCILIAESVLSKYYLLHFVKSFTCKYKRIYQHQFSTLLFPLCIYVVVDCRVDPNRIELHAKYSLPKLTVRRLDSGKLFSFIEYVKIPKSYHPSEVYIVSKDYSRNRVYFYLIIIIIDCVMKIQKSHKIKCKFIALSMIQKESKIKRILIEIGFKWLIRVNGNW